MAFAGGQGFQPPQGGRQTLGSNVIQGQQQQGGGFLEGLIGAVQNIGAPIAALTGNLPLAAALGGGAQLAGGIGQATGVTGNTPQPQATTGQAQVSQGGGGDLSSTKADINTAPTTDPSMQQQGGLVNPQAQPPVDPFSSPEAFTQYLLYQFLTNPVLFMGMQGQPGGIPGTGFSGMQPPNQGGGNPQ